MGQDDIRGERDQLGRKFAIVGDCTCGPADINAQVAAVGPAKLLDRLRERQDAALRFRIVRDLIHQHADAPHALALRPRSERPPCRRAAEQRDELAATDHSITSSASASSLSGISRPSALAVLRLMTNSNLVGWMIGKSAGFSPL